MLRETSDGRRRPARNVLGEPLESCSFNPVTGFFRNGCCDTSPEDVGSHTICIVRRRISSPSQRRVATIFRRLCRIMTFRASAPAIAGASARRAGRRRSRRGKRRAWL